MVTILVPVYNAGPYLRECVASLTGQTYSDLQIVLINDGSTDDSWTIMQELASQDKRIEIYSQSNSGVAATRNRLLDKVRGDFVLFVDSDDWIELDTVETLLHEQETEDYDIVYFQKVGVKGVNRVYSQETLIHQFLEHKGYSGMLWNKFFKSEKIRPFRIDETVSYGEDALFIWQVLQTVSKVKEIGVGLYHYRLNVNSISYQKFSGSKCTSYYAWSKICRDTDEFWPQYSEIAHARFACEMTVILMYAIVDGYNDKEKIRLLQEEVRRDRYLIKKTGISSDKMSVFSWLVAHCYGLVCLFKSALRRYLDSIR